MLRIIFTSRPSVPRVEQRASYNRLLSHLGKGWSLRVVLSEALVLDVRNLAFVSLCEQKAHVVADQLQRWHTVSYRRRPTVLVGQHIVAFAGSDTIIPVGYSRVGKVSSRPL